MADGDLKLSDSPNVDTGYVEQDGSLHRSVLVATPEGTLELSDNPNVDTGYVIDSDGKKHKVRLIASLAGGTTSADSIASTEGLADGNYNLRLTMADGVATLSWVAE